MKSISSVFLIIAVLLISGLPVMAQSEIYAIGTEFNREVDPRGADLDPRITPFSDSVFYTLDPNTGLPTVIGTIEGYTRCTGLDIHPVSEEFFAVCESNEEREEEPGLLTNNGFFDTYLLKIDPLTGQPSEVGPIELPRGDFISDMSFRSDGTLFVHLNAEVNGENEEAITNTVLANSLGILNTANANLTILGQTGSDDNFSGIGFNAMDTLLQCTDNGQIPGVINVLNQSTGNATFLANLIYPPGFIFGQNIVPSKDLDDSTGEFFAIFVHLGNGVGPDTVTSGDVNGNFLANLDQNGDIEIIGFIADDFNQFGALAVLAQPQPIAEVPTLSEYGLIVTVIMLLGAAVLVLRRRQFKSNI